MAKRQFWDDIETEYQRRQKGAHGPAIETPRDVPPRPMNPVRQLTPLEVPSRWKLNLRAWQREALTSWFGAGGVGVLEAVTGTGKTHLGLESVWQVAQRGGQSTILVPTVVLQEQWVRKLKEITPELSIATVGGRKSGSPSQAHVTVAVAASAARAPLGLITSGPRLLVADEVHRYGSDSWSAALRADYDLRMGLTATFERGSDDGVEEILVPYFRKVAMSYGYDRAVPEQVVAPFHLLFLEVDLSDEERTQYEQMSRKISNAVKKLKAVGATSKDLSGSLSQFYAMGGDIRKAVQDYQSSTRLRRDLLATSEGKLEAIAELSPLIDESRGTVVFTQTVETAEDAASVLRENGVASAAVHSGMSDGERRQNIRGLEDESLQALCAPKILDEGVDIPNIDLGIVVAASSSKRQMIQRLGRVIRAKDVGRWATFVVLYAQGTVEDPNEGAHTGFMELVRASAACESVLDEWDSDTVRVELESARTSRPQSVQPSNVSASSDKQDRRQSLPKYAAPIERSAQASKGGGGGSSHATADFPRPRRSDGVRG